MIKYYIEKQDYKGKRLLKRSFSSRSKAEAHINIINRVRKTRANYVVKRKRIKEET